MVNADGDALIRKFLTYPTSIKKELEEKENRLAQATGHYNLIYNTLPPFCRSEIWITDVTCFTWNTLIRPL